jgi:hypothetical protein
VARDRVGEGVDQPGRVVANDGENQCCHSCSVPEVDRPKSELRLTSSVGSNDRGEFGRCCTVHDHRVGPK